MIKPLEKIKLISQASALLGQLESVSMIKRIPILTELTGIIERLGLTPPPADKIDDSGAYDTNTDPTPAQAEAGNYKKGKMSVAGLDIRIENPKGSTRSGTDDKGETWTSTMMHHYGDIKGTIGADGDPVDVFVGEIPEPDQVFVIDQIDPDARKFDEHKVMLGFDSVKAAKKAYFANYADNWQGLGAIKTFTLDKFKQWIAGGATKTALKYTDGDFQEGEQPLPPGAINPKDYQDLDSVAVKAAMFKASERGHTLEEIAPVFDNWLVVNQAA